MPRYLPKVNARFAPGAVQFDAPDIDDWTSHPTHGSLMETGHTYVGSDESAEGFVHHYRDAKGNPLDVHQSRGHAEEPDNSNAVDDAAEGKPVPGVSESINFALDERPERGKAPWTQSAGHAAMIAAGHAHTGESKATVHYYEHPERGRTVVCSHEMR